MRRKMISFSVLCAQIFIIAQIHHFIVFFLLYFLFQVLLIFFRSRGGQRALTNDRFRPYRSSLVIRQLTSDDAGQYSAESEDSYGTNMLASIDLNVQKRKPEVPVFLRRLNDISMKIGSRARFLVEIESIPPLKVIFCVTYSLYSNCTLIYLILSKLM